MHKVKDQTVLFSAIGIAANSNPRHCAIGHRPGQVAYRTKEDFDEVVARLKESRGDYRILSIHYGQEMSVKVDAVQRRDWRRRAARSNDIDLIVGHHAHVVFPVEINGDSIVFYGLGNFLHHGTAQIAKFGLYRDFGLLARAHLMSFTADGLRARAVEILPLTDNHIRPSHFAKTAQAHDRIHVVNTLAAELDEPREGALGMRFTPQSAGTGLYCFDDAANDSGRIGALCRDWRPAPLPSAALRRRIQAACAPIKRTLQRKPISQWGSVALARSRGHAGPDQHWLKYSSPSRAA